MPPEAVQSCDESVPKPHLIFVYGTLKCGFPNHYLMEDLIRSNDAVPFINSSPANEYTYRTAQLFPLVLGPLGVPYLLNIPGSGRHVRGELYSVSARGLARLDELEGLSDGHYERMPMKVVKIVAETRDHDRNCEKTPPVEDVIEAEAYYAHRSYAEDMWRKSGMVGLEEYTAADADTYVKRENRPPGVSSVDRIRAYVASAG